MKKCFNSKRMYFLISFTFTIVGTSVFGWLSKPTEMGLVIVAGAFGMAFSNIDKFKKVSGAGFSAELKEIKEKTNEANITFENIKNLSGRLVASIQELMISDNSLGGIGSPEMLMIKKNLDKLIDQFGLANNDLLETNKRFEDRIMFKFCDMILIGIHNNKLIPRDSDELKKLNELIYKKEKFINPDYFQQFAKPEIDSGLLKDHIEQYREFSSSYSRKEKIVDI